MKNHNPAKFTLCAALAILGFLLTHSSTRAGVTAKVTYVSHSMVYINAGTSSGIQIGDTLDLRESANAKQITARVVVTQAASASCACRPLDSIQNIKVGLITSISRSETSTRKASRSYIDPAGVGAERRNIVSGDISVSAYARADLSSTGHSWSQPEISTRLKVQRLAGADLVLNMRHRSRYTHRTAGSIAGVSNDRVHNRLYTLSISTDNPAGVTQWGAGRILPATLSGMGYIDGAYVSRAVTPVLRIGFAGGAVPSPTTSGVKLENKKFGAFANYKAIESERSRLALSAALSSEFQDGLTSRDFIFLQSQYSRDANLFFHSSAEIDWNRGWRYERSNKRLRFTNYFGSVRFTPVSDVSTDLMFDTRKNVVRFVDSAPTDSLIDEEVRKSLRGGFRIRASRNLRLWASAGVRFRSGDEDNDRFLRVGFNARRFPARTHSLGASISIFESIFSTGYRPRIDYRLPVKRSVRLRLSAGGAFYSTGNPDASEVYLDAGSFVKISRRHSLDMSVRRYFSDIRSSLEVYGRISTSLAN